MGCTSMLHDVFTLSAKRRLALILYFLGELLLHAFVGNKPHTFSWAPWYLNILSFALLFTGVIIIAVNNVFSPLALTFALTLVVISLTYLTVYIITSVYLHWYQGAFWLGMRQGWYIFLLLIGLPLLWKAYRAKLNFVSGLRQADGSTDKRKELH